MVSRRGGDILTIITARGRLEKRSVYWRCYSIFNMRVPVLSP